VRELYRVTRHQDLPPLPTHSEKNWREGSRQSKPIPSDYQSPEAALPLPEKPEAIVIAGSMNANNAQLNYASSLVTRASEVGARIHVGDNDKGVDARVVETAKAIGYEDVVVWTAGDAPRNGGVPNGQIRKVPYNRREPGNRYTQRDRTMLRSLDADTGVAFFISNGVTHRKNGSLTGTEAGYTFAVEKGIPAKKVTLTRDEPLRALPRSSPEETPTPASRFSLHAVPTTGAEGQPLWYSAVALRDDRKDGEVQTSYALELSRFDEQNQAQEYVDALTQYIEDKDGLALSGSPDEINTTRTFFHNLANKNDLQVIERSVERRQLLEAGLVRGTDVPPQPDLDL
jgi:hypothetical protein